MNLLKSLLAIVLVSSPAWGQAPSEPVPDAQNPIPAPQIARFTAWLDIIDNGLTGLATDIPDRLYHAKTREQVFNIQALSRIYKDQDPAFKVMLQRFKDLEDAIGDYQKWADYDEEGQKKGESPAVLAKLKANRDAARQKLVDVLQKSQFLVSRADDIPYTQQVRLFLANYAWADKDSDRAFVVKKLVQELEGIKTARYDFTHLEAGNGVHEFRRKMRWFSMESRGLNGLIVRKPDSTACPVPAWSNLIFDGIAHTKYAVLPPSPTEPEPLALTPCLYIKVARLIEDVNQIKAKLESNEVFGEGDPTDHVGAEDQVRVQAMLDEALTNDLFGRLQAELQTPAAAE